MSGQLGAAQLGDLQLGGLDDGSINLSPGPASIVYTGGTPVVELNPLILEPGPATIVYTGGTPVVTLTGGDFTLSPGPATITYTGGTPTVSLTMNLAPGPGQITYFGGTPGVTLVRTAAAGDVVYIGDTAYSAFKKESPIQLSKTLSASWSAQFDLRWYGGTLPACGQDVAFFWQGVKRFGGVVAFITETAIKGSFTESILTVRCSGFQAYLDRFIIAKLYTLAIGGTPPVIIFDVWLEHLKQFGVTINYPQGQIVAITEQLYHYITGTEVFNRLREQQPGYEYYISDNKELIWLNTDPVTPTAPFTLRNSDENVDGMSLTRDNRRFFNSIWVLPAVDLGAYTDETFTVQVEQTWLQTRLPIAPIPIVRRNGVVESVSPWTGAENGSIWYYTVPQFQWNIGVWRSDNVAPMTPGDIVVVSIPIGFPPAYNVKDQASIDAMGLYETVYQAKDATSEAECLQIGAGRLEIAAKDGLIQQKLNFGYNSDNQSAWLTPGMVMDVDRTFPKALGNFTIEQVNSTLEGLTVWRHSIAARSGLGEITDQMALQAFRTSGRIWVNVPPILATMELGIDNPPDTNPGLVVGLQPNTYRFRGKGVLASWDARFSANPPTGAALILDLLINGVSIFPSGDGNKINIGDGVTGEVAGAVFTAVNLPYADGDVLTVNVIQMGSTWPGSNGLVHLNLKPNTALPPA